MDRRNLFKLLGVLLLTPIAAIPKVPKIITRKLKATWTFEPLSELEQYHSVEAEKFMAEQIAKEIDEEILKKYKNRSINPNYYKKVKLKC
jgi:hypothetical protein